MIEFQNQSLFKHYIEMKNLRSRYPGLRPFDSNERQYFFGRDEEIDYVCRLLDLDNLIILHGPSGMGKSSLINAGILPSLGKIRNWDIPYHIVPIRFTNYDPDLARIRREKQGRSIGSLMRSESTPLSPCLPL